MHENSQQNSESVRARLNEIVKQKNGGDLPESTSWDEVTAISNALYEQLEEIIATHVTETTLTQREAEVWVLYTFSGEKGTPLLYEAIALALAAPNSPFGVDQETEEAAEATESPTRNEVTDWYSRAERKYEQARDLVGANTFYDREEFLESPMIVWLENDTINRLHSLGQGRPAEGTLDDVITRVVSEAETWITLEELCQAYLSYADNVAQIVLHEATSGSTLWFRAYGPMGYDLPDDITEADAIEIAGERYDFYFDQDPHWPADRGGLVTLYAADVVNDIEPVPLDRGIEAVRDRVTEAADNGGFDGLVEQ